MYDLHNVINLSVDVSHVLVLIYYLVNNKICLKQNKCTSINSFKEMIKKWEGPKCQCSTCDYVMYLLLYTRMCFVYI